MTDLQQLSQVITINNKQELVTSSKDVARVFGKEHKNVIRALESLDCSSGFAKLNFELSYKINALANNKREKYYTMTKDGFTFLAMGFTGKKAAQFKEAYILAFNEMQKSLSAPQASLPDQFITLHFHQSPLRGLVREGRLWVVGRDVAAVLNYRNPSYPLGAGVSAEHKELLPALTEQGERKVTYLSGDGVRELCQHRNTDLANALQSWFDQQERQLAISPPAIDKSQPASIPRELLDFSGDKSSVGLAMVNEYAKIVTEQTGESYVVMPTFEFANTVRTILSGIGQVNKLQQQLSVAQNNLLSLAELSRRSWVAEEIAS